MYCAFMRQSHTQYHLCIAMASLVLSCECCLVFSFFFFNIQGSFKPEKLLVAQHACLKRAIEGPIAQQKAIKPYYSSHQWHRVWYCSRILAR